LRAVGKTEKAYQQTKKKKNRIFHKIVAIVVIIFFCSSIFFVQWLSMSIWPTRRSASPTRALKGLLTNPMIICYKLKLLCLWPALRVESRCCYLVRAALWTNLRLRLVMKWLFGAGPQFRKQNESARRTKILMNCSCCCCCSQSTNQSVSPSVCQSDSLPVEESSVRLYGNESYFILLPTCWPSLFSHKLNMLLCDN